MKVFDIKCEIMASTSSILTKNKPSQIKVVIIEEKNLRNHGKVHIFWEGHKILRNLHLT